MSILTKDEIIKAIATKKVQISNFSKSQIGCASIDLTLDKKLRIFTAHTNIIPVLEKTDYKSITKVVDITKGYILMPGELVLGITKEKITLPSNICGWLNSRSRFARLGLVSHTTAPFIAPGISNKQVLEIFNAGNHPLLLKPNVRICQLVLQECKGNAKYAGKFKSQKL
jgi:dCTP deaminase